MWVEDYKWHYDYVRLAWDTGFSFDKCKSPNLDKNKICVIDIDQVVRERDVASVDRFISTVVQYVLDDEQAKVLDTNFVKIFRLSQLAVEFLLFCKKYLDNTVVLLKKELSKNREENKELQAFITDLQNHVDTLTRQQVLASFKCSICSKSFASEEYLNAHKKRRHNSLSSESYNAETDKLNLEIKQLKERLNNTEKLLKEKDEQSSEKNCQGSDINGSKVEELLEKFEKFKGIVDVELKELKMQKSFYEENYGKLFDIMINSKENIDPKYDNIPKAESTTQTDKHLHIENVNNRNVLEIKEPSTSSSKVNKTEVSVDENNVRETRESLETKISTTLAGIEDQMQAFWTKLNEIERTKTATHSQPDLLDQGEEVIKTENAKPKIKPRSKLSQPTHNTRTGDNAESLKLAIGKLEHEQKFEPKKSPSKHNERQVDNHKNLVFEHQPEPMVVEQLSDDSKLDEQSSLESQASESESLAPIQEKSVVVKPSASTPRKQSTKSFNRISSNKEVLNHLNEEIEQVVVNRIQELGISKSWAGIPSRTFKKGLEMLNHQAALTKKTYSNFDVLKKKINGDVEKQCAQKNGSKIKLKTNSERKNIVRSQNVVQISYRPKSSKATATQRHLNVSPKREMVEIKNRALYETDTESERNFKASYSKVIASTSQPHQMYSDVVNEFKSLSTIKHQRDQDSDMDDSNKKDDLQKGVLKNFPSVGSLSKKKVLFDLDNDSSRKEDIGVIQKTGGSTTSIASSILEKDASDDLINYMEKGRTKNKENDDDPAKEKDLNDLSDFDLSDL